MLSFLMGFASLTAPAGWFGQSSVVRTVAVNAEQLLQAGTRMEGSGHIPQAVQIYRALIADPGRDIRAEAHFRLARIARARGERTEAATLLRRVLDDRPDSIPARLELAQLLAEFGDEQAALRQLRAVRAGALPADVARLVDRFSDALRARRPFGASIEFAMAPDSNINRATGRDTLGTVLGDFVIDPDSKQRSGLGLSLRGQMFARRHVGPRIALLGRVSAAGDFYRHKAFDLATLDVAFGPDLAIGRTRLTIEGGATRRWYGFKPYQDSARIAARAWHSVGPSTQLRGSLSLARADNKRNDLQDGHVITAELGVERALDARTGVALSLAATREGLEDPGYSTRGWTAHWLGWRELGRSTMTIGATIGGVRADDRLALFPERRVDRYRAITLGTTFRQLTVGGFAPLVRFTAERNRSTIEFHDYRRRRAEVGVARAF